MQGWFKIESVPTIMLKQAIIQTLEIFGYEIRRRPRALHIAKEVKPVFDKIHYGCGRNYLPGWLNVDIIARGPENYMYVDLASRHPFPANSFEFGFSEDFIEHIDQASSILFLEEVHRTFRKGGVLRLTFPCLEAVLKKHFSSISYDDFQKGKKEAYEAFGHVHFYSRDSLALVAEHIGFAMEIVEGNKSRYSQLEGINARLDFVNLHVELTKQ
jgi:predicted SAM-dependent methyltransferase